ncbi:MAG: hypothetical protein IJV36_06575 [Prevotella sp.]|nr:hypothetical protein [Prevotella sp.]
MHTWRTIPMQIYEKYLEAQKDSEEKCCQLGTMKELCDGKEIFQKTAKDYLYRVDQALHSIKKNG